MAALKAMIKQADAPAPTISAPVMDAPAINISNIELSDPPAYKKGDALATRQAYGKGSLGMMGSWAPNRDFNGPRKHC